MNTKKLDNGSTPKGGKDNTRVVLTAAGAVAVGAGAGLGASSLMDGEEEKPVDEKENQEQENQNQEQENQNQEANNAAQQQQAQQTQQQAQQQQAQHQPQPANPTEPTPIATDNNNGGQTGTNGGQTNNNGGQTNNNGGQANNNGGQANNNGGQTNGEDVNAEAVAVAEHILENDDIDPDDIDGMVNIEFQETDVLYTENGDEIPVAAVTTPDGGEYLLADVNGDRIYDVVYDMDGNLVSGVEAGLNTNDAQLALDENGGYIPISEDDPELRDDGIEEDIIALGDDGENGDEENNTLAEVVDDDIDDIFEDEPEEEVTETPELAFGLNLEEGDDLGDDLLDA